jgi:hypoxanthine phosphoribosyltransferase
MPKSYSDSDINPISWNEFGDIFNRIKQQVEASGDLPDVILPILRSGAIPGCALAASLGVRKVAPIVMTANGPSIATVVDTKVLESGHLLVVEANVHSGKTITSVLGTLDRLYPRALKSLAVLTWAYGALEPELKLSHFYVGIRTNEAKAVTPEEAKRLGLRSGVGLFPWESVELELQELNGA